MNIREWKGLLKETGSDWIDHKAMRLAASLAFYTALSVAPLLVVVIAVAGVAFGQDAARGAVVQQIEGLVGHDGAVSIQSMIVASSNLHSGIIAMTFGIVVMLVGASGAFAELQDSLNTIWGVQPKPGRGVMGLIRDRFLSFTMVLGLGFLLLVSLVISAGLSAVGDHLHGFPPRFAVVGQLVHVGVSFAVVTLLFAMIYKVLPDAKIHWRDVWLGAVATSLLFTLGKFGIGLYLGHSSVGSTYGAAGSVMVVLLWVYYSAQILFFGAELTQVYAKRMGSGIEPDDNAVLLGDCDRIKQGMASDADLERLAAPRRARHA